MPTSSGSEALDIYEKLLFDLEKMAEKGKVDLSIVKGLELIGKKFSDCEEKWVATEKMAQEDAFLLYHASRSSRMIVDKMKNRFLLSEKNADNPKVVDDALKVLPIISEINNIVSPDETKLTINEETKSFLIGLVRILRNNAAEFSMLPSMDDEFKGIDREAFIKQLSLIADTLQGIFYEGQGPD